MKRARYEILGEIYTSKEKIKQKANLIKTQSQLNQPIQSKNALFLIELFKMHPRYTEKTKGEEIVSIWKKPSEGAEGNSCFYFQTKSGIEEDFSVPKCLQNYDDYMRQKETSAYRLQVREQIYKFKKDQGFGRVKCSICKCDTLNQCWEKGEHITYLSELPIAHVDHDHNHESFAQLLDRFKKEKNLVGFQKLREETSPFNDNRCEWLLANEQIGQEWSSFHEKNAKLRLLCEGCNLSLGKK